MDRPKKGNTITIKINGDHKAYQEELRKDEAKNEENSNSQMLESRPKEVEKETILETAAAQESEDDSFDWIIPESSENDIVPSNKGAEKPANKSSSKKTVSFSSYYKKKNGRHISSIFITAIFAVLIGTTIGVFMLKLLNGSSAEKPVSDPAPIESITEPKTDAKTKNTEKPAANTTSAVIKQQTVYVIQGGVFGSKEGADKTAKSVESLGTPAETIEMDNKFYLLLGVADSLETAKSLGGHYKQNGIEDVFAKPLLLDEKNFSGLSDSEKDFLEGVSTIYQTLSLVTSSAILTNKLPEEGKSALAVIDKQLKASELKKKNMTTLKSELESAEENVKNYESSKDEKSLVKAQQHLLNFLAAYYSL
ncbi:hypothetical protein [Neobacillus mesonae]|uniref:hypothetical protein n=1 Tax=Neobacillus mesonae TaxID=1193713 RepID=UPI00203EA9E6|nr:hypothetical protein [Neobacillus mesonae]MCM3568397.1 hypothetical protein [Neobacillus mesonae]